MIYIQKRRTPVAVKQCADKIISAPESHYKEIELPKDAKKLRSLFDQMPKAAISEALCQEQHGLCAYCMRRIVSQGYISMRIEHYRALSRNKALALDYQNYLGVCNGGEKENTVKPHVLCCDAARSEIELIINPWNKRQMEAIAYKRNGQIFVKDEKGNVKHDTSTRLIANRRSTYESVTRQFERWSKKSCLTSDYLKEQIDFLENQLNGTADAMEFIGVRLYFYKEKYKRLKRQGK